jgi:hypothetical protein
MGVRCANQPCRNIGDRLSRCIGDCSGATGTLAQDPLRRRRSDPDCRVGQLWHTRFPSPMLPSVPLGKTVGGTSEASPLFSGIVALADQVAGHSLGYLNPDLYSLAQSGRPDGIVPISDGSNTYTFCVAADLESDASCPSSSDLVTAPGFSANGSYNDATGWGTVDAAWFVPALARSAG